MEEVHVDPGSFSPVFEYMSSCMEQLQDVRLEFLWRNNCFTMMGLEGHISPNIRIRTEIRKSVRYRWGENWY
jgi:hypothetical protein